MFARILSTCCFLLLLFTGATALRHAGQPLPTLQQDLVADGSLHVLLPALRNLQGDGYSLADGQYPRGVEPLWAVLVQGLAWLVRDADSLLRSQVLLGALCWLSAGWLLFRWLCSLHAMAATAALLLWLQAGLHDHAILRGTAMGLVGLLLVLSLRAAVRLADTLPTAPAFARRAALTGVCVALLCFTEPAAALLLALWLCWIFFRQRAGRSFTGSLLATGSYLLPAMAIVLGMLLVTTWATGDSRAFASATAVWHRPLPATSTMLAELQATATTVAGMSLPGGLQLWQDHLLPRLPRHPTDHELWWLLLPLLLPILGLLPTLLRSRRLPATSTPLLYFAVFAVLHLLLQALLLLPGLAPRAGNSLPQFLLLALLTAGLIGRLGRWWNWLLALPLLLVVFASTALQLRSWWQLPRSGSAAGNAELADWLADWLPPGAGVSSFASGHLGFAAPGLRILDLDGLPLAGPELLGEDQLTKLPERLQQHGVAYHADRLAGADWQQLLASNPPWWPTGSRPLHCWLTGDDKLAVVAATNAELPAHPVGALLFAALAQQQHQTALAADRQQWPQGLAVATSCWDPAAAQLRHVLLPPAELGAAVDQAGLQRLPAIGLDFGGQIEILAAELVNTPLPQRGQLLLRLYLRKGPSLDPAAGIELGIRLVDATTSGEQQGGQPFEWIEALLHGSLALTEWPEGAVLNHTMLLSLPAGLPAGTQRLALGLRAQGGDWLLPRGSTQNHAVLARIIR